MAFDHVGGWYSHLKSWFSIEEVPSRLHDVTYIEEFRINQPLSYDPTGKLTKHLLSIEKRFEFQAGTSKFEVIVSLPFKLPFLISCMKQPDGVLSPSIWEKLSKQPSGDLGVWRVRLSRRRWYRIFLWPYVRLAGWTYCPWVENIHWRCSLMYIWTPYVRNEASSCFKLSGTLSEYLFAPKFSS